MTDSKLCTSCKEYMHRALEEVRKNHLNETRIVYQAADDRKRRVRQLEYVMKEVRALLWGGRI